MGERTLYCVFSDDKPKAPTRKEHVQQLITAAQESFLRLRPSKYPPQHATFKEEQLLNWPLETFSPAALFICCVATFALSSLYFLGKAERPVDAIFSFFGYLLAMALAFFALEADYLGGVIFIVYLGAILIFFVFVLFTLEPRWFSSSVASLVESPGLLILSQGVTFLLYFMLLFWPLWPALAQVIPSPSSETLNAYVRDKTLTALPSTIQAFGPLLYEDYLILTLVLGVLLLLALGLSMELLVDRSAVTSRRSFFVSQFVFFRIKKKND